MIKKPETYYGRSSPDYVESTPMPPPGYDDMSLEEVREYFEVLLREAEDESRRINYRPNRAFRGQNHTAILGTSAFRRVPAPTHSRFRYCSPVSYRFIRRISLSQLDFALASVRFFARPLLRRYATQQLESGQRIRVDGHQASRFSTSPSAPLTTTPPPAPIRPPAPPVPEEPASGPRLICFHCVADEQRHASRGKTR